MAVPALTTSERRVQYTTTGASTGPFAVTFPFFEIEVYLDNVLVDPTDYVVTQAAPGTVGSVTLDTAPTGALAIIGTTTIKQDVDYISQDSVEPTDAERSLDRLTMIAQEFDHKQDRTLRVGSEDPAIPPLELGTVAGKLVVTRAGGGIQQHTPGTPGYVRVDSAGGVSTIDSVPSGFTTSNLDIDPASGSPFVLTDHMALHLNPADTSTLRRVWPTDVLFKTLADRGIIDGVIQDAAPVDTSKLWLDSTAALTVPATWKAHNGSSWNAVTSNDVALHIVKRAGRVDLTPEDFGCVGDGSANDTVAFQAWVNSKAGRVGTLTPDKTYAVDTVAIPGKTTIQGNRTSTIRARAASGSLITIAANDVKLVGFTVDGTHTTDTVAGGFIANHNGILVYNAGVEIFRVHLDDLHVRNCGDMGISLRVVTDCLVENCFVERCGYGGVMTWSGLRCRTQYNTIRNIFPGNGGVSPFLNAYGGTFSNYGGQRISTFCTFEGNIVSDVPSWEGLDEHNGTDISFINNIVTSCSQGIAVQHGSVGQPARRIRIIGNTVNGFGATRVKDSTTFYAVGGIICNGAVNGEQGEVLAINDNLLVNTGDARLSPGGSGGIKVENFRNFVISGNTLLAPLMFGIHLYDNNTNSCLYGQVTGNVIDGVQLHSGTQRHVYATSRVLAQVSANFGQGGGSGFAQVGSPTFVTTFNDNRLV